MTQLLDDSENLPKDEFTEIQYENLDEDAIPVIKSILWSLSLIRV